jgi:MFS family permease
LAPPADHPLSDRDQTRNLVLYASNISLIYLSAPVLYVGIVQAALCERLGASDTISNLPSTAYLGLAAFPVLVAWFLPQVRLLKRVLTASFAVIAAMGAGVAVMLVLPLPNWAKIAALVAHGAVLGCANGVVATFQWEVLGRGVAESRRGKAFSLAFGAGPILAVLGSLGSQVVLTGKAGHLAIPLPPYPWSFALLFAVTLPTMALASFLSSRFVIPEPTVEVTRQPFVSGVFGGFGEYFSYRLILLATVAYILVYSGHMIMPNLSLYTREALGQAAEQYAGYQNALRFSFKVVAGFLLGWILTRTHPKVGLLITASLCFAGVTWALLVPGRWFLVSFGILGAGELFGVYFPNYILCCSPKSRMRRNMALVSMITVPVGFAPVLFGWLSDSYSLRVSFMASLALIVGAIVLVLATLPARPGPRASDLEASDAERPVPLPE